MGCTSGLAFGMLGLLTLSVAVPSASAQKAYGHGVTDTEIKLGATAPFSGPASAYSGATVSLAAYFAMINENGGMNGRKINFIALDDGYGPPKTVEQSRKLIEDEGALALVSQVGAAPNHAIKYVNQKKVPDLFTGAGATVSDDPDHCPRTLCGTQNYSTEGKTFAKYILKDKRDAKVGILWQNADLGRDYLSRSSAGSAIRSQR